MALLTNDAALLASLDGPPEVEPQPPPSNPWKTATYLAAAVGVVLILIPAGILIRRRLRKSPTTAVPPAVAH